MPHPMRAASSGSFSFRVTGDADPDVMQLSLSPVRPSQSDAAGLLGWAGLGQGAWTGGLDRGLGRGRGWGFDGGWQEHRIKGQRRGGGVTCGLSVSQDHRLPWGETAGGFTFFTVDATDNKMEIR